LVLPTVEFRKHLVAGTPREGDVRVRLTPYKRWLQARNH
jgi:hypothetical protein